MTISEFLLARIAEDEAEARDCAASVGPNARMEWTIWEKREVDGEVLEVRRTLTPYDPARVLAECEAKRRIVELHPDRGWEKCEKCPTGAVRVEHGEPMQPLDDWPCFTLRALAAVYADHAEFQEEWRV